MSLRKNYESVKKLFEAFHELRHGGGPPDSQMVAGILFCITNDHLIALLRFMLEDSKARAESRSLSKRSSLFDKLILMKGENPKPWVLRLHTYQIPRQVSGQRLSNLGEAMRDDEANTHFHRWQLGSRFLTGGFNNVTWDVSSQRGREEDRQVRFGIPATSRAGNTGARKAQELGEAWVTERSHLVDLQGRLDQLTVREREVLAHLMHGRTVREIASVGVVSEATVRTQVKAILAKLDVTSQIAAVGLAHQVGWRPPQLAV